MISVRTVMPAVRSSIATVTGVLALALGLAACGGSVEEPATANAPEAAASAAGDSADDTRELADDLPAGVEDMKENLEDQQAAQGGGSAILTAGDQTWIFDTVLCGIGEEETGQEGAEFVLSSMQDGLQFYVSVDSFGHSVSLSDIDNFDDPSVSLDSSLATNTGDFIKLDGKNVSGQMAMWDDLTAAELDASFEGTCP